MRTVPAIKMHIPEIKTWLQSKGAEILPTTNDFELLRYKGKKVGVIYSTGNVNAEHVREMLKSFHNNLKWKDAPVSTGRKVYVKQKVKLLERDGDRCFYCGKPVGEDITVEHLIPLTSGGTNLLSNMVLAHFKCNQEQGFKPLNEKVQFAIQHRFQQGNNTEY